MSIGTMIGVYVYLYWLRLGGDRHYHPPAPWSSTKIEEIPIVATIGPLSRWLKLGLRLFDAIMILSVAGIPLMMLWMYHKQAMFAFKWFGLVLLPLSLLTWIYWCWVKRGILQDMQRALNSEALRNGIPHHGMLIVVALKYLLLLGLWGFQVVITVNLQMEGGALVFGAANVLTNLMLVGIIYFMTRVERGFSASIDEKILWGSEA